MDDRNFFEPAAEYREAIGESLFAKLEDVQDSQIREILLQRVRHAWFIKGTLAYLIHRGLDGNHSQEALGEFACGLELYATGIVVLDNLVDQHEMRNNTTTYLKEFGPEINSVASFYAIHLGLIEMAPYLKGLIDLMSSMEAFSSSISLTNIMHRSI